MGKHGPAKKKPQSVKKISGRNNTRVAVVERKVSLFVDFVDPVVTTRARVLD